jgi:hypothetical protein
MYSNATLHTGCFYAPFNGRVGEVYPRVENRVGHVFHQNEPWYDKGWCEF